MKFLSSLIFGSGFDCYWMLLGHVRVQIQMLMSQSKVLLAQRIIPVGMIMLTDSNQVLIELYHVAYYQHLLPVAKKISQPKALVLSKRPDLRRLDPRNCYDRESPRSPIRVRPFACATPKAQRWDQRWDQLAFFVTQPGHPSYIMLYPDISMCLTFFDIF